MSSFQQTTVLARVGADPKHVGSGEGLTSMRIAVDRPGKANITDWWDCVAFGKTGELIEQFVRKGDQVLLSGRVEPHAYQGKDGFVASIKLVAERVTFVGSKKDREDAPAAAPKGSGSTNAPRGGSAPAAGPEEDPLPF